MITTVKLMNVSHIVTLFCLCSESLSKPLLENVQYSVRINCSHCAVVTSLDLSILHNLNFVPFDQYLPLSPTSLTLVNHSTLSYCTFNFCRKDSSVSEIMQAFFSLYLVYFTDHMSSSFIHIVANDKISFEISLIFHVYIQATPEKLILIINTI